MCMWIVNGCVVFFGAGVARIVGGVAMSSYLLRLTKGLYKSTPSCPWCEAIDAAMTELNDNFLRTEPGQRRLADVEALLVNGYGMVRATESAGAVTTSMCAEAHRIPMVSDDALARVAKEIAGQDVEVNMNLARMSTAVFGRWCAACGARKHDIVDLRQWARLYTHVNPREVMYVHADVNADRVAHVTWSPLADLGYPVPGARLTLTRMPDEGASGLAGEEIELALNDTHELDDVWPDDGRAYVYTLTLFDELGVVLCRKSTTTWLAVTPANGQPMPLRGLALQRGRILVENDAGELVRQDMLTATVDVDPTDTAYGGVLLRWNEDHVPDQDWHMGDHDFDDDLRLVITADTPRQFFLKPLVYSRLFRRDGEDDHLRYPELRLWNTDVPAQLVRWRDFEDCMLDLMFVDGWRSITITWHVDMPWPEGLQYFRVMLKQTDEWITDGLAEGYKVFDVPVHAGVKGYEVDITGLAAGVWWTCGVFPVYADSTPDVRLEYQHKALVQPANVVKETRYGQGFDDFYYTGMWKLMDDSNGWNGELGEADHKVMTADLLNVGQVAPLLVHQTDASDIVEVEFDYKVLTRDASARFTVSVNEAKLLTCDDTGGRWLHAKVLACGTYGLVVRWDYQRAPWYALPWNKAMVDNIVIRGLPVVDDKTDNYSRVDILQIIDKHIYNRRFKFDSTKMYTSDRISLTKIVIDPYIVYDEAAVEHGPSAPGPWVNVDW